jgi:hypothetical protein
LRAQVDEALAKIQSLEENVLELKKKGRKMSETILSERKNLSPKEQNVTSNSSEPVMSASTFVRSTPNPLSQKPLTSNPLTLSSSAGLSDEQITMIKVIL